jgi:hypothetical protein
LDQPATGALFAGTQYEKGWFDAEGSIITVTCWLAPGARSTLSKATSRLNGSPAAAGNVT